MIKRPNPVGIAAARPIPIGEMLLPQIRDLHHRVRSAEQDRQNWIDKQRTLLEQRRGIRRPKVVPWVGANNDNWPVTDGVIRRWKPGITGLILDSDPVAYFWAKRPDQVEAARSAQAFWHWQFTHIEDVERTVYKLADMIAQHGMAVTHEGWDYHVEPSCRIVLSNTLFPGGIQVAYQNFVQSVEQQNAQIAQAVDQGQAPPDTQPLPVPPQDAFVKMILMQEYEIGNINGDEDPDPQTVAEEEQLAQTVDELLAGAPTVKIIYHTVIRDKPAWAAFSPLDVIFPTRVTNPERGDYVGLVFRLTKDEIRKKVRDGVFMPSPAEEVIAHMRPSQAGDRSEEEPFDARYGGSRAVILEDKDRIEGIESRHSRDEPFQEVFWKMYCHLDVNGDGINEKCILWYNPGRASVMSLTYYPFPFEEWPITVYEFEHIDDRPYSARGAAELLSVFQKQVNRLHNARLDAIQIVLAPMFTVRSVTGQVPRNVRFRPGQFIPVQQDGDFKPVPMDVSSLFQFLQEENYTKNLAEQYVGVFDSSVLNQQAAERRTATEVEAVNAQVANVFTGDARLFQSSFARSTQKLWKLWREFGEDDIYFRVTGEEQPRQMKKWEIDQDFDIEPAGTPANTNKALALSRARESLQLGLADQSGVINKSELWKNYFELTDRNLAKRVVRGPEAAAAVQMIMQAASQATGGQEVPAF